MSDEVVNIILNEFMFEWMVANQEPLPTEFKTVYFDNCFSLYDNQEQLNDAK